MDKIKSCGGNEDLGDKTPESGEDKCVDPDEVLRRMLEAPPKPKPQQKGTSEAKGLTPSSKIDGE